MTSCVWWPSTMRRVDMTQQTQLSDGAPVWTVRPVGPGDAVAVQSLSEPCALPAVQALIQESLQAFAGNGVRTARHVFVLCADQQPRGVAAVVDHLGMNQPRYSFRTGVVVHASAEMAMFNALQTLALGNDTTGATELLLPTPLSGLSERALAPLIQAMLWYVADLPQRFAPHVVCELPGIGERGITAPFWQALGRHFYAGPLPVDHDLFAGYERSAVGRLMPKHTLYSSFLGAAAQACVGQVSPTAVELRDALLVHGLRFCQHVNMFDAGPILEAALGDLRGLGSMPERQVRVVDRLDLRSARSCCLRRSDRPTGLLLVATAQLEGETVAITADSARDLGVESGEGLRVVVCP